MTSQAQLSPWGLGAASAVSDALQHRYHICNKPLLILQTLFPCFKRFSPTLSNCFLEMRNRENNKFNQIKPIVRKRGRYFRYVRGEQWTRTNDEASLEMISYRSIFVQFRDNVEIFPIILRLILNNVSIRCQLSIDIFTHR